MWSLNKKVDLTINILIFLVAINFLHYGQLILPIICLILFVDNKCKFKVNDIKIFIVLCLFALSFFIFSVKDFYCVMGFTLPMAYYIGSNIKDDGENNIRKLIDIIAGGMICHVVLNFAYELSIYGNEVIGKKTRYDIWTQDEIVQTLIGVLFTIPFACTYYLINFEKNKKIKYILLAGIVFLLFYNIALGRRTPIAILIISIVSSFIASAIINKGDKLPKWPIIVLAITVIALVGLKILLSYSFNYDWELYYSLTSNNLIYKIDTYGLDGERINSIIDGHKIMFSHLWGKEEISNILGIKQHEFWFDIYDYSGIISYILMIVYSIDALLKQIKIFKNKNISSNTRILLTSVFICIVAQLCVEPVMTCSTIFLLCSIIILTSVEKLNI